MAGMASRRNAAGVSREQTPKAGNLTSMAQHKSDNNSYEPPAKERLLAMQHFNMFLILVRNLL